ncbi:MAG: hypothetical protein GY868_03815, partial [Deltaproteobacteria bacterium]|nr:hypothetical protein [Deltaproteobacteria bacterium]
SPTQKSDTPDSAYLQHYFFSAFSKRFMELTADVRPLLENKFPQLLSDLTTNLHRLSEHAMQMIEQQQLDYQNLNEGEQTLFMNQFMQHIDTFAIKVQESISTMTPEQEARLHKAYAGGSTADS